MIEGICPAKIDPKSKQNFQRQVSPVLEYSEFWSVTQTNYNKVTYSKIKNSIDHVRTQFIQYSTGTHIRRLQENISSS